MESLTQLVEENAEPKMLKSAPLILALVALDAAVVHLWDVLAARLGGLIGLELGLIFFLNVLVLLYLVEGLEGGASARCVGWFRALPPLPARWRRSEMWIPAGTIGPRRWAVLGVKASILAVVFVCLETALLPLLPLTSSATWLQLFFGAAGVLARGVL